MTHRMEADASEDSAGDLVTRQEAADELRVSTRTIDRYIDAGDLDSVKVGSRLVRVRRASVERMKGNAAALAGEQATS